MSNQINERAARYQAEIAGQNPLERSDSQAPAAGKERQSCPSPEGEAAPTRHSRDDGNPLPIINHLDLWASTVTPKSTSGRGRGSGKSNKLELTGIKKLRELILELAVRGKLVAQNPDDEPASKLLERIEAEKAQLIKDGKLKKQKPLAAVSEDEKPFELPEGWAFVRLGSLSNITGGFAFKSTNYIESGSARVIRISDFNESGLLEENTVRHEYDASLEQFKLENNNILMAMTGGTVGKACLVKEVNSLMVVNQRVATIKPPKELPSEYLYGVLKTSHIQNVISEAKNSTNDNISMGDITGFYIPLPPLAEQQRIVAKVDELMALCDQLEQQSEHQLDAHMQLTDTLLGTLLQPAAGALTESADATTKSSQKEQLNDNWKRLAQHFDLLFSGPMGAWAIDRLKDTILQLAVMGKLVPQNPEDEPASKLLERIEEEKARLVKEGKLKKPKKLPPVSDDEKPFELPEVWEWVRFDNLIHPESVISYGVLVPGPDVDDGVPFVRIEDLSLSCPSDLPNKRISRDVDSQYERTRLHGGEILMGVVGSIGKLGLAPSSWKGANIARAVCRIDPSSLISKEYIITILQSQFMQNSFAGDTRTLAQPTLNIGLIRTTLTPLPPLAEQQRIVAKVDELFALCDQLKDRLQKMSETEQHLTNAIVEQALN